MFRAPACIDALEDRLNTSIEYFITHNHSGPIHHVTANCAKGIEGVGYDWPDACHDLLCQMGLEDHE